MSIRVGLGVELYIVAALRKDTLITATDLRAVAVTDETVARICNEICQDGQCAVVLRCTIDKVQGPALAAREERKLRQLRKTQSLRALKKTQLMRKLYGG